MKIVESLNEKIDASLSPLARLDRYWNGTQPGAFLAPEAREALGNRLRTISVNYPRLAVQALVQRLRVTGFEFAGASKPDEVLWRHWQRLGLSDAANQAHTDALLYGRSFVGVWADAHGAPLVSIESLKQVAVLRDPATRCAVAAIKRWSAGGQGYGVLYEPDVIRKLKAPGNSDTAYSVSNWTVTEEIANPYGIVPIIPLVNRGRLLEEDGVSEIADLIDLADLLNKLVSDMAVTSEYYACPRRWATGLEIVVDDDGEPVQPFSTALNDVWQSEAVETKFGQFPATGLAGYTDAVALVTQQIGALSNLPPHYLGLNGDQPTSADSIRSSEASLISRCLALQQSFGQSWRQVAALMQATLTGADPTTIDVTPLWADPSTRTPAQASDAAVKLRSIGVPLSIIAEQTLDWEPALIERMNEAIKAEQNNFVDPYLVKVGADADNVSI